MGHRHHQRQAGLEDAVHLAQQPSEVVDLIDGVCREHEVARRRCHVTEIGEIGLEALHVQLRVGGASSGLGDAVGVGVDGDRLRAGASERHRVEAVGDAEFDGTLAVGDVSAESQFVVGRRVGSVGDVGGHIVQCAWSATPGLGLAVWDRSVATAVIAGSINGPSCEQVASQAMAITVGALRGSDGSRGLVDHRLARRMLISQVRKGRVPLDQVCDAHPELIRAARNVGTQTSTTCPICEDADLKLVTYVFGARLSAQGRCVSTAAEMQRLNSRADDLSAYVVEACVECRWNHLLRVIPVGGRAAGRAAR